jgi:patatin-related protein
MTDLKHEIRFGVVMYGGISLAIYMGGITQELLHLARGSQKKPGQNPEASEAVYRKVAHWLDLKRSHPTGLPAWGDLETKCKVIVSDEPRTAFIIDTLSGTSAGGINAVFLAKALVDGSSLNILTDIWARDGDIGRLLDKSADGGPSQKVFLNGRYFFRQLYAAFDWLNQNQNPGLAQQQQLDLFVTTTDLQGLPEPLPIPNASEKRYAHVFRFRHDPRANESNLDQVPMLAFASRVTAGIPGVFEAFSLQKALELKDGTGNFLISNKAQRDPQKYLELKFFPKTTDFADRAYSDGGVMDNKPFSYTIKAMKRHPERGKRVLVYLEPTRNPSDAIAKIYEPRHPVGQLLQAGIGIPRDESIRADLDEIARGNSLADDLNAALKDPAVDELKTTDNIEATFPKLSVQELVKIFGPAYRAYHQLKLRQIYKFVAKTILLAAGEDSNAPMLERLIDLMERWVNQNYSESNPDKLTNKFVVEFDFHFRLRRLRFLRETLRDWLLGDPEKIKLLETNDIDQYREKLTLLHYQLTEWLNMWRLLPKEISSDAVIQKECKNIITFLKLNSTENDLDLKSLMGNIQGKITSKRTLVSDSLRNHLKKLSEGLDGKAGIKLFEYRRRFNEIDMILFPPVAAQNEDEIMKMDVWRLGTEEATSLIPPASLQKAQATPGQTTALLLGDTHPKIAGASLAAFGAFLKEEWRLNDIFWGRLDAAEILIKKLMDYERCSPSDQAQINIAVLDAQQAIWKDFWKSLSSQRQVLFKKMYKNTDSAEIKDVIASREANFVPDFQENFHHIATAINTIPEFIDPTMPDNERVGVKLKQSWIILWGILYTAGGLGGLMLWQAYSSHPLSALEGIIGGIFLIPVLIAGVWQLLLWYASVRSKRS